LKTYQANTNRKDRGREEVEILCKGVKVLTMKFTLGKEKNEDVKKCRDN
jgi:hypothetical protein